jgi:2'-5' RNA ligase
MRLFIAIHLPDEVKAAIEGAFSPIYQQRPRGLRFVKPDNIHLTLKFLGDTDGGLLPELTGSLDEVAAALNSFSLAIAGAGAFPHLKRPRVFWVGISGDVEIIAALAKEVNDACAGLGFPGEKRAYSPHLTVARVKDNEGLSDMTKLVAELEESDFGIEPFEVTSFSLVRSTLTPRGAVYEDIARFGLGTGT